MFKKRRRKRKNKMGTMDKVLIAMALFLFCYVVTSVIIFILYREEMAVLTGAIFTGCIGEAGFLSAIKKCKIKEENSEDAE